ncbi:hypothetical protein [Isoptericola sediminis]|uniref:Flp pilus-assembly TadE/G-like protein n=1 Tax=Isoptericola sediminis TaxID=2733572 RepID=A0A849K520_9MICO|nr:hypothetical protein [Isoptericola sediminis]NNU27981.1 hypothetical protein [Isoptericola sediminis]
MLLTAGFVAVGLMLVGMVASAASVHLDRKHLFDLADSLAVAGADSMARETYYGEAMAPDGSGVLTLTDDGVRAAVAEHLAVQPASSAPGLRGVRVHEAATPDGRSARVSLVATSHPPLIRWFTEAFGGGITVTATATARAG